MKVTITLDVLLTGEVSRVHWTGDSVIADAIRMNLEKMEFPRMQGSKCNIAFDDVKVEFGDLVP